MRKRLLAAVTALCMLLSGCAAEPMVTQQTEQTRITFSWWGNDKRTEYTIEGIELLRSSTRRSRSMSAIRNGRATKPGTASRWSPRRKRT